MKWTALYVLTISFIAALFLVLAFSVPNAESRSQQSAVFTVTAYCLHGTTATGTYTKPGTIAVDPRVVRLWRRITVSGYGTGRALDTGSAIRGYRLDVWFSSCYTARRWGVQKRRVWW